MAKRKLPLSTIRKVALSYRNTPSVLARLDRLSADVLAKLLARAIATR